MKRLLVLTLMAGVLFAASTRSADVGQVTVDYEGGEYRVQVEALLNAPADVVFDILTDFDSWPHISGLIVEATVEDAAGPAHHRVRIRSRGCVFAFCKTIDQVQWVTTNGSWHIEAEVLPQYSDLRSGWARTELVPEGSVTRFHYEMTLVPDFWVPPLIGPAVLRHKLREEAIETARTVEMLAAHQAR